MQDIMNSFRLHQSSSGVQLNVLKRAEEEGKRVHYIA